MSTVPVLEVRDLKLYFTSLTRGAIRAVDGVSFHLNEGEVLGIVGESGSGKSVTSLGIMGLVPPNGRIESGQVLLDGEDLTRKSDRELRDIRGGKIAMILQDPMSSLNPSYTVGFQVSEAVSLHQGLRGKTLLARVVEALKLLKIPAAETRVSSYPHQLSGGMRQRVSGAIGLSCEPRVLIADEPTTSLDVTVQAQYLRLLKEIQEKEGARDHLDHPRSRDRGAALPSGSRDVRRSYCRDRDYGRDFRHAFASIHHQPSAEHAEDRGRGPAGVDRRGTSRSGGLSPGLPLRAPVPLGPGQMP